MNMASFSYQLYFLGEEKWPLKWALEGCFVTNFITRPHERLHQIAGATGPTMAIA